MKKAIFNLFLLLIGGGCLYSQSIDVEVYHGSNGTTEFHYKRGKEKIIKTIGDAVRIKVLNPNTLYYTYEFKVEEVEIKEDNPNISSLVLVLQSFFESSENAISSSIKNSASRANLKEKDSPLIDYRGALRILKNEMNKVEKLIRKSDNPDYGIKYTQDKIEELSGDQGYFNDPELLNYLDSKVDATKEIVSDHDDDKLIRDLLKVHNASIVNGINELKKKLNEVKRMIVFSETVGEKQKKIKLIIKKRAGVTDALLRDEIDREFLISEPEFQRKSLEVIPVANLTYASNTYNFSLVNGLVSKVNTDGWKFRPGAMLIGYPVKFGVYKEWAVGIGLGFNIPKDQSILENFYAGSNISYKNVFRIGVGWGFSEYPSSLKNDVKEGTALPQNINKIDDIIVYGRKSSFFITFSISGIPLL